MSTNQKTSIPSEHLNCSRIYQMVGFAPTRLRGVEKERRSADPYYVTFPDSGQYPPAPPHARAVEAHANGRLKMRAPYRNRTAMDGLDPRRLSEWNRALLLLGALNSFGVITNNQAAAFVGDPALADPCSRVVSRLYASDLVRISSPYVGQSLGGAGEGTTAYQIGDRKALRRLRSRLTPGESTAFSGARAVHDRSINIRHDILGAELALRAADLLKIGTVLGPQFSTFPDLTAGCDKPSKSKGESDLTLVRDDGVRVTIEITATLGERFKEKVQRIVRTVSEAPMASSGLVVIFLLAPAASMSERDLKKMRKRVYHAIADAVDEFPFSGNRLTAERIGIATWREWFPAPLVASERFGRLTVDRLTGRGRTWEEADLWDPAALPFEPHQSFDARAIIKSSALMGQTPSWLRAKHRPAELSADLLRRTYGLPGAVAPERERSGVRIVGAAHGVAGEAAFPPRLIGPADNAIYIAVQPILAPARTDLWAPHPARFGNLLSKLRAIS